MIRSFAAALFATGLFALPAFADTCQDDVSKIDAAILADGLAADIKAQAEDMRNNAVQLCGAGNTEEGLAVTAEAKVLLKVE
jgi:hypothetical protein